MIQTTHNYSWREAGSLMNGSQGMIMYTCVEYANIQ